jgi:hypothetical protein
MSFYALSAKKRAREARKARELGAIGECSKVTMCMVPQHALEVKNYPTGLGGHKSIVVLLFLLFSFKADL